MIAKAVTLATRNIAITGLIVVAIIMVAVVYMLFTGGQSAADSLEATQSDEMLIAMQLNTVQTDYDVDDLEEQKIELNQAINTASSINKFPETIDRDQLELDLSNEAKRYGVTLKSLSSTTNLGTETIGDNQYSTSEIRIQLEGLLKNTGLFMDKMENGDFPTLKFKGVSLSQTGEGGKWITDFTLVILSQG